MHGSFHGRNMKFGTVIDLYIVIVIVVYSPISIYIFIRLFLTVSFCKESFLTQSHLPGENTASISMGSSGHTLVRLFAMLWRHCRSAVPARITQPLVGVAADRG